MVCSLHQLSISIWHHLGAAAACASLHCKIRTKQNCKLQIVVRDAAGWAERQHFVNYFVHLSLSLCPHVGVMCQMDLRVEKPKRRL